MPPRRKKIKVEVIESSSDEEVSLESQDLENFDHWSVPKSQKQTQSFQSFLSFSSTDSPQLRSQHPTPQPESPISHQWVDKYRPRYVSEICINPTKLKQVKDALRGMLNHTSRAKILVLSGPSGCSKSTTVRLLAEELLPRDSLFDSRVIEYTELEDFARFLQECRYKTGSVVLVEELPNVYHLETLGKFRDALKNWIYQDIPNLPPLVICLTEIEYNNGDEGGFRSSYSIDNNLTVDTLLSKEISKLEEVENIKFNKIANRFLKKTVNRIIKDEQLIKSIGTPKLNGFLEEIFKIGDIRSIIHNLEIWVKNVTLNSEISMDSYLRENSINLFHAIGKVIYSTTTAGNAEDDSVDMKSIEQVLSQYPEKNKDLLNLGLLENYHIYNDTRYDLNLASNIVDDLSLSDIITLGDVGVRSTRVNLRKVPKNSNVPGKLKMKFPRHFKMNKMVRKTSNQINSYRRYISPKSSFEEINLVDGYFLPIIYNKRRTSGFRYNRLGGKFQEIYADEDIPVEEEGGIIYEYDQFEIDIQNKINEELEVDNSDDELSDPIEDSEQDNNNNNDDDDDDVFLSDSELDLLLTQGNY
ncbi:Checkpoint protein RAD24 [Candida viswanathii]|uniref:Checkpoint protein RAD24 n=1 Tax=Candida viswanathii TaxID=5486 RepID=A0A367Y958_9ASCO|nr:Checkpoint protein RAD24 [Candida viswanathii]